MYPLLTAALFGSASGLGVHFVAQQFNHSVTRENVPKPWVIASPIVAAAAFFVAGPVGLLATPVPWLTNTAITHRKIRQRGDALTAELAPALQLIISQLRIGRNILGAITEVAPSIPDPLGPLLRDAVAGAQLGIPIDEELFGIARDEKNPHLEMVASAISIHSRLGGSLTDILQTVVDDIEEEDRLKRDIRSLTADGRLSAQILLAMPPAMLLVVSLMSPGYASPLVTDPLGRALSGLALVLAIIGVLWLRTLSSEEESY